MKRALRHVDELRQHLNLPQDCGSELPRFPVFVPLEYAARMEPGNPADPLLRQVLPLAAETKDTAGFVPDPVDDHAAEITPGLLQKYAGRALLVTTGACAVHCRYCFRQHYPYSDAPKGAAAWQPALAQLAAEPSISEIILSGGDPLTLADSQLTELIEQLAAIPHLQRLRVHTRLPLMIPSRITTELVATLNESRLAAVVVIHANHANELGTDENRSRDPVSQALARLVDAGIPVLNQTVLLRGINDSAEAQIALHTRLVNHRVLPYYLHQLDRVQGAQHFEVPESDGLAIIEAMRRQLPGYAVPRYVREIAAEPYKVPLLG